MDRSERRRRAKDDKKLIAGGIDPVSSSPMPTAGLTRLLFLRLEEAKCTGNIDPVLELLHSTITATLNQLQGVPIACKKGCSHCCYIWVSVTAPEALHIAKVIRNRGEQIAAKVMEAHVATKSYNFDVRDQHPYPCPLLDRDQCSIYGIRPQSCRLAGSGDAEICRRSYHNETDESIPTPVTFLMSRTIYSMALACALRRAALPFDAYEFNGALAAALKTQDAEKAWLAGEDIFAGVGRDPGDIFAEPNAVRMYQYAFEEFD